MAICRSRLNSSCFGKLAECDGGRTGHQPKSLIRSSFNGFAAYSLARAGEST